MLVTKRSVLTGQTHTMDLNVTAEQLEAHRRGANAQDAFAHLSIPEREFLISGITPEEWAAAFPEDEEEEEEPKGDFHSERYGDW